MFLRMIFISLFCLIALFSISYGQDSNTVNYSLFLEKTLSIGSVNTKVDEGVFKEGQSFTIPEAELPATFAIYQDVYNGLVGGRFGIDYGAINHDLIMKIYIRNLDPNAGKYKNLGESSDTLFSYFEIRIWELPDSNLYRETSSYYFNDGHFATFSLPKSLDLINFLEVIGIGTEDSLAFAFMEPNQDAVDSWNGLGIETIDTPDSIKFKAIHLSRIGGGRKNIAEKEFVPNIVNSIKINQLMGIPTLFKLEQNYPNPFNPTTNIRYAINHNGNIRLDIYNIIGEHVQNLVNKYQTAGNYEVEFSSNNSEKPLSSGLYIYSLKNDNNVLSKKMLLIK